MVLDYCSFVNFIFLLFIFCIIADIYRSTLKLQNLGICYCRAGTRCGARSQWLELGVDMRETEAQLAYLTDLRRSNYVFVGRQLRAWWRAQALRHHGVGPASYQPTCGPGSQSSHVAPLLENVYTFVTHVKLVRFISTAVDSHIRAVQLLIIQMDYSEYMFFLCEY